MAAADATPSAGSSGLSVGAVSEEKTYGTRLLRLVFDQGTHAIRKVFDSVHPPATLQQKLRNNKSRLEMCVFEDQWENLFPASGNVPDSKTFDITLLHLLLRTIKTKKLRGPRTGWCKMPKDRDSSLAANIVRIKCLRDELCHNVSTSIAKDKFEEKWNIVSSALVALGIDQTEVDRLKTAPTDHDTARQIEEEVTKWKLKIEPRIQELESTIWRTQAFPELRSRLPNKLPEELMFGRTEKIKEVKDLVQSGEVAVVVITGGPGFGKTTVAKEVARELTQPNKERTVLFCSLVTKRTFSEVATEMIHLCDRIHTNVPENPEQWLKNWSKQITTQVTFVLDNADNVLESKDRSSFLNMLSAVRMSSTQNVTFVVTSRRTFNDDDLQPRQVRLKVVEVEEAKNILISRVSYQGVQLKLSREEKIVELCGCVPLALSIVGSLLSDYTEERLIKQLEKQPLAVLQDDDSHERSMKNAIKTSFDLLTQAELQEAFVLMSVFSGPFNSDAAEAVMAACSIPGTLPDSILRSLKNRSLLEQPSPRVYQMHPLIQAFAKDNGEAGQPRLVAAGEKLACAHFMSRLAENANRYWSKNGFRESVEAFNADRNNFEHFLHIFTRGRKNKDCDVTESCKTFLRDFPLKCRYLEMCVLPKLYSSIPERLLETFDSETQAAHRVELLCLLGHESRKLSQTAKYNEYMEEARKLYERKCADFETNSLSEVIYLNSYARFLLEQKGTDKPMELFLKALRICEEKLPSEHPERAATLLFAGRLHKRRKEELEASKKINQALQLFEKSLGEHFMTALCPKQMADLLLFSGNETEALSYYQQALEMMKKLGMDGHKESIMTLKNYGVCLRKRGNLEEAENQLEKAEGVAKRELDEVHMWKVRVKTEQAILYKEQGNIGQMEKAMKKGLQMCYKLGQTVEKLGYEIRETLDRYPELFPKQQYPR